MKELRATQQCPSRDGHCWLYSLSEFTEEIDVEGNEICPKPLELSAIPSELAGRPGVVLIEREAQRRLASTPPTKKAAQRGGLLNREPRLNLDDSNLGGHVPDEPGQVIALIRRRRLKDIPDLRRLRAQLD